MSNDVTLNKAATISKCLLRVRDEYDNDATNLRNNQTKQDAIVLNLQRAAEASIDLAMYWVARKKLGVPQQSRDAFRLLAEHKLLAEDLANKLQRMVGFRNIAVHDYQRLNLDIVQRIVESDMEDFAAFAGCCLRWE